jgi:CDP-glucose 4,6-dehydratase
MKFTRFNPSFWYEKKVFVTGHTGFKGSWICLWLQQLGAKVTGFSLKPHSFPNLFEVARVENNMNSYFGDIRDLNFLSIVMCQAEPEIVIHLAAQSLVRQSYSDPVETYSTNVMGTVNLFEAVRKTNSVRAVLNVTSDKCYENRNWLWGYRESEPLGGSDPYSSSKGCSELITSAYRHSFFNDSKNLEHRVALATARAGNVIGGGDWSVDRLIPDTIRAIEKGESVCIRCPDATRPWQHVLEPISGYLNLSEKLYTNGTAFAEAFNFGPLDEDVKPVRWIVDALTQRWGEGANWKLDNTYHPYEAKYLKLDSSKTKNRLNLYPKLSIEEAIRYVVEWHKAYQQGADMQAITVSQINEFINT